MLGLALDTLPAFVVVSNALAISLSTNNSDSLVSLVLEMCFLVVFILAFVFTFCIFALTLTLCGPECCWIAFDMVYILAGVTDSASTFVVGYAKTKLIMLVVMMMVMVMVMMMAPIPSDSCCAIS